LRTRKEKAVQPSGALMPRLLQPPRGQGMATEGTHPAQKYPLGQAVKLVGVELPGGQVSPGGALQARGERARAGQ
jgi:hypothetical protein